MDEKLNSKLYIIIEALLTIKQVELVRKKEFAAKTLNPNDQSFVAYIVFFASFVLNIHSFIKLN